LAYDSDGNANPAQGARGGLAGGPSSQFKRRTDGTLEQVPGCAEIVVGPSEAMVPISCGGGGYGPPCERDPGRVLDDVREGWITRVRAQFVYRVAITDTLEPDIVETARLRGKTTFGV
jgi:N-methylhydantoinase B